MTAIGILGLDTSHAAAFADCLAALDADGPDPRITAVWDDGTVRDDDYVTDFCSTHDATRYGDPAALVGRVDAALVLTVDWDRHVPLAEPFLEASVPTLVDKPIAGSVGDLDRLSAAAGETAVFGGSALPFHPAFAALPTAGRNRSVHLAGYNDYFYYRVHVADTARRLAGADWTAVSPVTGSETSTVAVSFANDTWMTLRFDGPTDEPAFAALDVADRSRTARVPATEDELAAMYEPYLRAFLDVVRGERQPTDAVLDGARLTLAVEAVLETNATVERGDETLDDLTRPAAPFVADYQPYH